MPSSRAAHVLRVPVEPRTAQVYEEGWQSWSPTTWYPVTAPASARPEDATMHAMRFRPERLLPAEGFSAEGLLAVDPGDGSDVMVVAGNALTETVPSLTATLHGDELVIVADGPVRAHTVTGTGPGALAAVGDQLARGVRVRPAPRVWCSWYHYFGGVTQADLEENMAGLTAHDLPVEVIQLDDGWAADIGDWTRLSGTVPDLAELARRIADTGRRPGIWIAPFTVTATSEVARKHPDWLVGDGGRNWGTRMRGLDLTHPDARDYLAEVLTSLVDAGYDYLKLDFLYCGALAGARYGDDDPVAAYRSGLQVLRDSVGSSYLVGCGAPIFPSIGLVDAMRVSGDTFHEGGEDGSTGLRGEPAVRARRWQHGRFWSNDADCLVARPAYRLRERLAGMVAEHGGLRSVSDRVADLDDWGVRTSRALLENAPGPDPMERSGQITGGHE